MSATHTAPASNTPHAAPPPATAIAEEAVEPFFRMKEAKFFFRTVKTKTDLGELVEAKRETVKLELPIPTLRGVAVGLHDDKVQEFILGLVENAVIEAARAQVGDENKPVNVQEELDLEKLTLLYLANEPKADRRGRGIAKELWEAFAEDYISIMPALLQKPVDKVTTAAQIFCKRLIPCKTNKPVLRALEEYLDIYTNNTTEIEQFSEIVEYLKDKFNTFINLKDEDLLANL